MKKSGIAKLLVFIIAVLYLFNSWGGRECMYYIPSEKLYISVCLSPISNNYYLFFNKDHISGPTPDYVYNWMHRSFPAQGFSKKPNGSNIIYIQGGVDAITKVHSESLRFMLFHSVENWSGPREFPEYNIGDSPNYNNPDFELLMYDDRSPYNTINIIKLTPIWSKRLSKTGWIRKVFRNEWNHCK